jgi:hypothetical protein
MSTDALSGRPVSNSINAPETDRVFAQPTLCENRVQPGKMRP